MRYVTTSAGRNLRVFEFFETPAMHRSIVFSNLVDPKRRIVLSHEARIGVAASTYIDHLRRGGLTNISLRPVHCFQFHLGTIPTVTGNTPKSFLRVDVPLVQFDRLRQLLHAECSMANYAGFALRLSVESGRGHES